MATEHLEVDGKAHHWKKLYWTRRIPKRYCPLCLEELKECSAIIIFNNWKVFPNTVIHAKCCEPEGEITTGIIHQLENEWLAAQEARVKYKAWE